MPVVLTRVSVIGSCVQCEKSVKLWMLEVKKHGALNVD
jgi:hypothetical protein